MGELYGEVNKLTMEWNDGLMPVAVRQYVQVIIICIIYFKIIYLVKLSIKIRACYIYMVMCLGRELFVVWMIYYTKFHVTKKIEGNIKSTV